MKANPGSSTLDTPRILFFGIGFASSFIKSKFRYMKKLIPFLLLCVMSSCATVFGGKVTTAQKTKPKEGEPKRKMRGGYVAADILCGVIPLGVDLWTGAIYKKDK